MMKPDLLLKGKDDGDCARSLHVLPTPTSPRGRLNDLEGKRILLYWQLDVPSTTRVSDAASDHVPSGSLDAVTVSSL